MDAVTWRKEDLSPQLLEYILERTKEFSSISEERAEVLRRAAEKIRGKGDEKQIVFVCTHNSRRSHYGQIWAQAAATHFGVEGIKTYSAGTETTACNPRTAASLVRAGFLVKQQGGEEEEGRDASNPIYDIQCGPESRSYQLFSKTIKHPSLPKENFVAIMTCGHADQTCPVIRGTRTRVSLQYDDPKQFDDTPQEEKAYSDTCALVARELLFIFSHLLSEQKQSS
mmetsp:Transcript_32627/g.44801  ORF Transcript_32627/g.44801 Transcript_32627/m.44801 type:complete len:226 (-) Transcript_32627:65-742(-)|eukprot:CAMPEP_0201484822 /NCGR_PEP_ID=MMETSP0151_2-20130828/8978_1 /ASSEMBLY_ACC=CAM_ASM_000257 /TAXON_ID=200890 /ORGANISM="Paramoeba atlantica, Strain 621/1 / CCAP 1560/9" /LENGTH=225 /DNA_ID=CAMNT_0047868663 /DNA_START=61 /DNA_END=738 /DNA_ORIENTATION=-